MNEFRIERALKAAGLDGRGLGPYRGEPTTAGLYIRHPDGGDLQHVMDYLLWRVQEMEVEIERLKVKD